MLRSIPLVVGLMIVVGWLSLSMPFRGDEALFAVVAKDLSTGSVLYRDHWDITNPGIFWFYQAAGTAFGFREDGIRLFEWLWLTAFVLAVAEASRRQTRASRLPLAPAILVGAVYYAAGYSQTSILTKTEGLAGFPMFLAIWFAARAAQDGKRVFLWLILAGAAGGVVVLFKLLLGGCLAFVWFYLLAVYIRGRPAKLPAALLFIVGIAAGLLLVLGPAIGYFAMKGVSDVLVRTLFELPPRFLAEGDRAGPDRLAISIKWFLGQYAPVLAAAVLAVGCRLGSRRDPFVVATMIAFAASLAALLAQRLSWWSYHFLLPGTLAGVIAAYCWPAVVEAVRTRLGRPLTLRERALLTVSALLLLSESLGAGVYQTLRLAGHGMGITAASRKAFRESTGESYTDARAETAWLGEPGAQPGPIYVCGDPLFYWLSARKPAVPISGWSLEVYPSEIRAALAEEIRSAAPVYVFVSSQPYRYDILLRDRYPEVSQLLKSDYRPLSTTRQGIWYERLCHSK